MTAPLFALGVGLLPVNVEAGATVDLSWMVDIQKAISGLEQRVGTREKPQMRFEFSVLLDDAKGREFMGKLARYAHTAPTWRMPLFHEATLVASSTAGPNTIVCESLALCDWNVAGQPIVVVSPTGVIAETIIASSAVHTLTVDNDMTATAIRGARVLPVMPVVLDPLVDYGRFPVNAGMLTLTATTTRSELGTGTMGTGSPALTTYDGFNVWDAGIGVDAMVPQPLDAGYHIINTGFLFAAMASYAKGEWKRELLVRSNDRVRWQWFKKFLDAIGGAQKLFLAPTGRPDLVHVGTAATGTLTVYSPPTADAPDYILDWYPSLAHRRLCIVKTDGTKNYRKVNSTADLGGTQELVLDSALAGAIDHVELLETVHLEGSVITVNWNAAGGFVSQPTARVVQR